MIHLDRQEQAIQLVKAERERQFSMYGYQTHDNAQWLAILMEEVGEAAQAANDDKFGGKNRGHFKEEMVQVCAVALQILESVK